MGYNLSRMDDGLEWTCSQSLWSFVLESAKEKGWQPMGTFKIDDDSGDEDPAWDGRTIIPTTDKACRGRIRKI